MLNVDYSKITTKDITPKHDDIVEVITATNKDGKSQKVYIQRDGVVSGLKRNGIGVTREHFITLVTGAGMTITTEAR